MKIYSEIEAAKLPLPIVETMKQMKESKLGGEVVVVSFNTNEIKAMRIDFLREVESKNLYADDQATLEKAELMHMIGIALKNSHKGNCTWFKSAGPKILQDAPEFDEHSVKTLITGKDIVFIIVVYNGRWIGGEEKNDRIIRDEPDDLMEEAG